MQKKDKTNQQQKNEESRLSQYVKWAWESVYNRKFIMMAGIGIGSMWLLKSFSDVPAS